MTARGGQGATNGGGLASRIAATLREHGSHDAASITWSCFCGADFHDANTHEAHVAEMVVAALRMDDLISDVRTYLAAVTEDASWFCLVDDIGSILDSYEAAPWVTPGGEA